MRHDLCGPSASWQAAFRFGAGLAWMAAAVMATGSRLASAAETASIGPALPVRSTKVVSVAHATPPTGSRAVPSADSALFHDLARQARGEKDRFRAVDAGVLQRAAGRLRMALQPLDRLLNRSKSGSGWRTYLDWPALQRVASDATAARQDGVDARLLDRLQRRFESGENGLAMPQFAGVRRALDRYRRAAEAASRADAATRHAEILERLAEALDRAAEEGTSDALEPVGRVLDELEATGQSQQLVARVRAATGRPNLLLDVSESLLATAVNRPVDETAPVDEMILGNRVRGMGRTTGTVRLDFTPSHDRAAIDLVLDATNHAKTYSGRGPVTVYNNGQTMLGARKRLLVDADSITPLPTQASAEAETIPAGIAVSKRFGKRLIRRIAERKAAEIRPQAEAIAEGRAREKLRRQFDMQTAGPIAEARSQYPHRFRDPLVERGWYPEVLHFSTTDSTLSVAARKAISDQIAAASPPPPTAPSALLSARVHDTLVNNVAEITLGGRTITQADIEKLAESRQLEMPEAFGSDPDQKPWSITFSSRRPVELDTQENWMRVTIRGDAFTSGEREFPGMDIQAAYRVGLIEGDPRRICLVRDGDVQIYPPGFVPGSGDRLTVQETSLRRILQRRFNRIFDEIVEVEPLQLPGQLEAAGPLPMEQLLVRKDGWISVGWGARSTTTPRLASLPAW